MKLLTCEKDGHRHVGVLEDEGIVPITKLFPTMLDLIEAGQKGLAEVARLASQEKPSYTLSEVTLLTPIPEPRRNVYCVGLNYRAHIDEGKGQRWTADDEAPQFPAFFDKATGSVANPGGGVPFDEALSSQMDFEAELAVIISPGGRSIQQNMAMDHVFGYTAANDITFRDIQRRHGGQWIKGKSVDRSCPLGPFIVTKDEIRDPQALDISCSVNGVEMQRSNTSKMIFGIGPLVSHLSWGMTLVPGDILLTGTPEGVGYARKPPRFLRPGDTVEVTVSGVGTLRNTIVSESLTQRA